MNILSSIHLELDESFRLTDNKTIFAIWFATNNPNDQRVVILPSRTNELIVSCSR